MDNKEYTMFVGFTARRDREIAQLRQDVESLNRRLELEQAANAAHSARIVPISLHGDKDLEGVFGELVNQGLSFDLQRLLLKSVDGLCLVTVHLPSGTIIMTDTECRVGEYVVVLDKSTGVLSVRDQLYFQEGRDKIIASRVGGTIRVQGPISIGVIPVDQDEAPQFDKYSAEELLS